MTYRIEETFLDKQYSSPADFGTDTLSLVGCTFSDCTFPGLDFSRFRTLLGSDFRANRCSLSAPQQRQIQDKGGYYDFASYLAALARGLKKLDRHKERTPVHRFMFDIIRSLVRAGIDTSNGYFMDAEAGVRAALALQDTQKLIEMQINAELITKALAERNILPRDNLRYLLESFYMVHVPVSFRPGMQPRRDGAYGTFRRMQTGHQLGASPHMFARQFSR